MNAILKKSIENIRLQQFKAKANRESAIFCQLWSDKKERNHLDFTATPENPPFTKSPRANLLTIISNLLKEVKI